VTARKTAAKPKPPTTTEPEEVPMLEITTESEVEPVRKLLFKLDGEPIYGTVVGEAWMSLEYLEVVAEKGQDFAMTWLLRTVLGEEGYAALRRRKGLKLSHLGQIVAICQKLILGDEDEPPKASRRRA